MPDEQIKNQAHYEKITGRSFGEFHLLALGVEKYKNIAKDAIASDKDTEAVCEILKSDYGFIVNRLNNNILAQEFFRTLSEYGAKSRNPKYRLNENDHLVIWISGHGEYDKTGSTDSYFSTYKAKPYHHGTERIDHSRLKGYLKNIKARKILVVIDTCYSGGIFFKDHHKSVEAYDPNEHLDINQICDKSRQALTSGRLEKVRAVDNSGHSPFSYIFLEALRNNKQYAISANQIYKKIMGYFPPDSDLEQTPLLNPLSNTGAVSEAGEFVFFQKNQPIVSKGVAKLDIAEFNAAKELTKRPSPVLSITLASFLIIAIAGILWTSNFYTNAGRLSQTALQDAERQDTIDGYETLKRNFPQFSNLVDEKKRRIVEREHISNDKLAYVKALNENSEESFSIYIKEFPDGINKADAEGKMRKLESLRNSNVKFQQEKSVWENAKKTNTPVVYQSYMNSYPSGAFFAEAEVFKKNALSEEFSKQMDTITRSYIDGTAIPGKPYYVDVETGKRIKIPAGVTPVPIDTFYVDPSTGELVKFDNKRIVIPDPATQNPNE